MSKMNLQKKISIAKIAGKMTVKRVIEAGGRLKVAIFAGIASGFKDGVSDFGEWTALTGRFRGVNCNTGEQFDSGVCFMPDVAMDLVLGQLRTGATAVEFAFEIWAVEDEESSVGFVYNATPILEAAEDDPMARLLAKVGEAIPALSAPASPAEGEKKGKK